MSCRKDVDPEEGKLFAAVFCCLSCYDLAVAFMERAERDLFFLRTMMLESIRQGLLEGKLQFASTPAEDVSKKDLLTALADLVESVKKEQQCQDQAQPPTTHSGETMKLPAPAGSQSGSSST